MSVTIDEPAYYIASKMSTPDKDQYKFQIRKKLLLFGLLALAGILAIILFAGG